MFQLNYFKTIVFIFLYFSSVHSKEAIPTITCIKDHDYNETSCHLSENLALNETHPHFHPLSSNNSNINIVELKPEIKMHTFTNDTCLAFPNLKGISAIELGLKVIQENAFEKCLLLELVTFTLNNLTTIAPHTFATNEKLRHVNFQDNQLISFDFVVFENVTAETLVVSLASNQLKNLNYSNGTQIFAMTQINLSNNYQLETLGVQSFLQSFPNLQTVLFYGNMISTEKCTEFTTNFRAKNIIFYCHAYNF